MIVRMKVLQKMLNEKYVVTANLPSVYDYLHVAAALWDGGLNCMEVLLRASGTSIPRVHLDAIYELRKRYNSDSVLIGAGTVQTPERAQAAIDQGAQFIVSNLVNKEVVECANLNCVFTIPGVRDDASVQQALRLGCWVIKIFMPMPFGLETAPIIAHAKKSNFLHLEQYRNIFPNVEFLVTGGIETHNAKAFFERGYRLLVPAILNQEIIENKDWKQVKQKAIEYRKIASESVLQVK